MAGTIAGVILVLVGVSYYFPVFNIDKLWPILLILAGGYLIWKHYLNKR